MFNQNEAASSPHEGLSDMSRRSLFKHASVVGATTALALSGFSSVAKALDPQSEALGSVTTANSSLSAGDTDILIAAEIAEALAVTTYSNIVHTSPLLHALA
jgi:lysozyme family protein